METSLETLVELAKSGDKAALEEIVTRIQDDIYRLSLKMLWHPADTEYATQEIVIKIITQLSKFRGESLFPAWSLGRADTLVWLDYPFPVVMWQLLKRTIRRTFRQEVLWARNRESFRISFLSRDSILWWGIKTYRRRRTQYIRIMSDPDYAGITFIRLTSPAKMRAWLAHLSMFASEDK
ncbi:MAG: helix-turn-helix domain-containing protein [Proteobacteria bacterium]|nr:helix-turn-helix domain-containing protein [Pseudomonadota bacterium]